MIQMIAGVFGLQVGGIVKAMDKNSGPFEVSPEQEARLIRLGLAVHVDDGTPIGFDETPPMDDEDEEPAEDAVEDAEEHEADAPVDLNELTAKELREIGKEYGLTFKANASKASMIAEIEAAQHEDAAEDIGEPAPVFDASDAVL